MNRKFILFSIIFAAACSNADFVNINDELDPESPIAITAQAASYTKGELVYSPQDMLSMGLFCAHTGGAEWSEGADFDKMIDTRFEFSDQGECVIDDDPVAWDYATLNDYYSFCSYAPHSSDVDGLSSRMDKGELFIDYSVPSNSIKQPDLMIAEPIKNTTPKIGSPVHLTFYHALASVSFGLISSSGAKVDAITVSGVIGDGILSWDYSSNGPTWSPGGMASEPFIVEIESYSLDSESSVQINSDQGYLMMIPQRLTDAAQVTISLDNGDQRTLAIPTDREWEAGSKYHYVIKLSDDEVEVECENVFSSDQVANCYIIKPETDQNTIIQIPIEDRINDFWLNYVENGSEKITSQTSTDNLSIDMVWHDFDEWFEFDCDFVNDSNGKLAVEFSVSPKYQQGNFVFVVSEVSIKTGSLYILPLWSWHLWFTDYDPDAIAAANKSNIKPGKDRAYTLDGYEGAVHRYRDAKGADDSVAVWRGMYSDKFIMDRNIGERNTPSTTCGAGTVYFQYGRKDPFPGLGGYYSATVTQPSVRVTSKLSFYNSVIYHDDYVATNSETVGNWSVEDAARGASCIWFDERFPITDYVNAKSIFDPSPLGWRVPMSVTWSYFNNEEGSSKLKSVAQYNSYGYRDTFNSGAVKQTTNECYLWSANPCDSQYGYCLHYSDDEVSSSATLVMSYGLPVRAIQE